jgi:hypothetical protein
VPRIDGLREPPRFGQKIGRPGSDASQDRPAFGAKGRVENAGVVNLHSEGLIGCQRLPQVHLKGICLRGLFEVEVFAVWSPDCLHLEVPVQVKSQYSQRLVRRHLEMGSHAELVHIGFQLNH